MIILARFLGGLAFGLFATALIIDLVARSWRWLGGPLGNHFGPKPGELIKTNPNLLRRMG